MELLFTFFLTVLKFNILFRYLRARRTLLKAIQLQTDLLQLLEKKELFYVPNKDFMISLYSNNNDNTFFQKFRAQFVLSS